MKGSETLKQLVRLIKDYEKDGYILDVFESEEHKWGYACRLVISRQDLEEE
jgi:hypothetical protein